MTRPAPPNGFVLVGVVMFVLALTILVLSLFTLSSYEAQSLTQSHARTQGSYDAESGVEMVKALIMTGPNFSLASAGAAVGSFNVIRAVAKQHRSGGLWDSTGVVTGDSTVWIRVTSQNFGERKTLEARFKPNTARDYYKRLFTIANGVEVENTRVRPGPTIENHPATQLRLSGLCWQFVDNAPSDTLWAGAGQTTWNAPHFDYNDAVTLPDLPGFFATHPASLIPDLGPGAAGRDLLQFNKHPNNTVGYYSSPSFPLGTLGISGNYTFEAPRSLDIEVSGTVVWMIPAGVMFRQQVNIQRKSGPPAVLIIVAGPNLQNPSSPDGAIHFQGGLNVDAGPVNWVLNETYVVLVSDAKVIIEFANEPDTYDCYVYRLSVLSRDLLLEGPKFPGTATRDLRLSHDPSMDTVIQSLYAEPSGPLPRPPGSTSALTLIRGSWRSATP